MIVALEFILIRLETSIGWSVVRNTGGNILRAFFTNNELQSLTETIEKENMFELNLFGVRDADFFKSNAGGDFGLEVNDAVKKCE